MQNSSRATWTSSFGLVMASVGSAVGLGNLWRFPFVASDNGGGTFVVLYLLATLLFGLPLLLLEMGLGKKMHLDAVGSFARINPHFKCFGIIVLLCIIVIMSYYCVVGSWIVYYLLKSFSGINAIDYERYFYSFISSPIKPLIYLALFISMCGVIVAQGVTKGIEKYNKIMMPALFVLLLVLMVRSLTLEGAEKGISFFMTADFSTVTMKTIVAALGQAFFSLSLGMGVYITYGSYMKEDQSLIKDAYPIPLLDIAVALCAGITIISATFAFGVPLNSGPGLVFITLPKIFAQMPFGSLLGISFFLLLLFAALTSCLSLLEVFLCYTTDELGKNRTFVVFILCFFIFCAAIPVSLSFGLLKNFKLFDRILFDQMDALASNILLPLGGLLTCIAVGWFLGVPKLDLFKNKTLTVLFTFLVKYILPVGIIITFLNTIGVF